MKKYLLLIIAVLLISGCTINKTLTTDSGKIRPSTQEINDYNKKQAAEERNLRRIGDIRTIQQALILYNLDTGKNPDYLKVGDKLANGEVGYLTFYPSNPIPHTDGNCPDQEYEYKKISNTEFQVSYCLGQAIGNISAGKHIMNAKSLTAEQIELMR